MLVVAGLADQLTYANNTESDFNRTCKAFPESDAKLRLYPGTDHDVTASASVFDYIRWIKDRFDQVKVEEGCSIETVEPATARFRTQGIFYSGSSG
jgi:hypothetical protein